MNIVQRGNPDIMKSIQKRAKEVSEGNGLAELGSLTSSKPVEVVPQAGAYASMMRGRVTEDSIINSRVRPNVPDSNSKENCSDKRLMDRLMESVETLTYNKEYYNATSSLFTLYSMGALTNGIMETLSREDVKEIKGIIREFRDLLNSY